MRWFSDRGGIGHAVLLCAVLALAPLAAAAREPDPAPPGGMIRPEAEAWRDRYCTGPACARRSGSPASALGFGIAVLATGWMARRRGLITSGS